MPARLGDLPNEEFRRIGHEIIDWIADYWEHPERYPVVPDVQPGELVDKLPVSGPDEGESMDQILADFQEKVMPHVTHWNHPGSWPTFRIPAAPPVFSPRP